MTTTKVCRTCSIEKPIEEFGKAAKNKDGRNIDCRPCAQELKKARAQRRLEKMTDAQLAEYREKQATQAAKKKAKQKPLTPEQKKRKNMLPRLGKFIRERDELKPIVDRLQADRELTLRDSSVSRLNSEMEWTNKTRFEYAGYSRELTNIENRYGYVLEYLSEAGPELIAEAQQQEIDREAGLTGRGMSEEEKRDLKLREEWRKAEGEKPATPEVMADSEAFWYAMNNTDLSSGRAEDRLRHHIAKGSSESVVNRARYVVEQEDAEYQQRWQETYDDAYSVAITKWKAKDEAGEIGTMAEEFPRRYGPTSSIPESDVEEARKAAAERLSKRRERVASSLLDDLDPQFDGPDPGFGD